MEVDSEECAKWFAQLFGFKLWKCIDITAVTPKQWSSNPGATEYGHWKLFFMFEYTWSTKYFILYRFLIFSFVLSYLILTNYFYKINYNFSLAQLYVYLFYIPAKFLNALMLKRSWVVMWWQINASEHVGTTTSQNKRLLRSTIWVMTFYVF